MISDYYDFFLFLGGLLILGGIIYLFFRRFLQNIFISEEEISKLKTSNQLSTHEISFQEISKNIALRVRLKTKSQASLISVILLAVIIGGFLLNQFLMWKMDSSGILSKLLNISIIFTKK